MQFARTRNLFVLLGNLAALLAALCLTACAVDGTGVEPEASAEQRAALTAVVQINAGGEAISGFSADGSVTGGSVYTTSSAVSTSGVANAAPAAVYQSERFGNFSYSIAGLSAGTSYTVRLHFAEIYFTSAGSRVFNVVVNGAEVISNLDIYASVGAGKALVRELTVPASSDGQIVIQYVSVVENAKASAIEIYAPSAAGNAAPTVASAAAASPNPTSTGSSALSVLGADDGGEANLTYTWTTVGTPPGAVSFSTNGSNAAKNVTATFAASGSYALSVTARDAAGATATSSVTVQVNSSAPAAAPPPPAQTAQYRVNCGGGAVGAFSADTISGGGKSSTTRSITTSATPNAAPMALYQTERYGAFSYTFTGLGAGASYTARLHFAETYFTATRQRVFNVKVNGATALSNFDIYALSGRDTALTRDFTATASSSGQIVVQFVNVIDDATCSGIEILSASSSGGGSGGGNAAPTVATAAAAGSNPVTSTTTGLSVRGADDGGESNLTYTWGTTGTPPASVSFSVNGSNAAKATVATFSKAGTYDLVATIRDASAASTTSRVSVVVSQRGSSISVTPSSAQVAVGGTQQFSAVVRDQFGTALATQPSISWASSGGGSISSSGLFSAGASAGGPYSVSASNGSLNGSAAVTITSSPSVVTYSTDFGLDEATLSEGGAWKHNNSWFTKVLTRNGVAYGTQPNPARSGKYEDAYAFLGGMGFPPNQYASGHVYKGATGGYLEVELLLRVADSANSTRGYECYLHQSGEYLTVARWNGTPLSGPAPLSYFDVLTSLSNVTAPRDGDLFEAQIVGNIITVKLAGRTLTTVDVSDFDGNVFASGDPGIGFCAGGSGAETANSTFGFRDFSAKGL